MFSRPREMLLCLLGLLSFWFSFIRSGIQNMAQCAMRVSHYFEMVSKHGMSLIRIRAVIMFYYHSNNSMTHFTFSYVNPRISIYNRDKYGLEHCVFFTTLFACCPIVFFICGWTRDNSSFSLFEALFFLVFPYFCILRITQKNIKSSQLWYSYCMRVCLNDCICVSLYNYRDQNQL